MKEKNQKQREKTFIYSPFFEKDLFSERFAHLIVFVDNDREAHFGVEILDMRRFPQEFEGF